jgi:hypothetical protein
MSHAIEVDDLVKHYGRVAAVRGVTLEVRHGETVCGGSRRVEVGAAGSPSDCCSGSGSGSRVRRLRRERAGVALTAWISWAA